MIMSTCRITWVVEEIAAHGDSCAVGVLLLRAIVDTDSHVRDVVFAIMWNVFAADENDSVGTFADSRHALSETLEFLHVAFAPQFLILEVHNEVPHFHEMAPWFCRGQRGACWWGTVVELRGKP